jgi:hypothetical protein
MKILGKAFILFTIIALILFPIAGCTGPEGPQGAEGPSGDDGADGTIWYTGSSNPGASTGVNGDLYLNTNDGSVWQKSGGSWSNIANITGPQGVQGTEGTEGPEGPSGDDGADGAIWYTGSSNPGASTGVNGDLYLNTDDGSVWQKSGGSWSNIANITGPQGEQGPEGPEGPEGPAGGPAGPEGPAGPAGSVRQIVVTWNPYDQYIYFGPLAFLTAVDVYPGQYIRIKGAGFDPGDIVRITICQNNTLLVEAEANDCGAFEVFAVLPGAPPLTYGPVSLKAWVDVDGDGIFYEDGELQACWPLDIVEESYFFGIW